MKFTAQRIAEFLDGTVEGDPLIQVSDITRIEEGREGTLSFLSNPKYQHFLSSTEASLILVDRTLEVPADCKASLIRVKDPYASLAKLMALVEQTPDRSGQNEPSYVSPEAEIGENVYVGAHAYVAKGARIGKNVMIFPNVYISEGVEVGEGTIMYAGVKIHHNCQIGKGCILHSGVIIGGDGFGFAPVVGNSTAKVPQIGNVIVEDKVEIGSNTTIDRATIGSTIIRKGVKLDNLIQIGHNVEIGENTLIAAQTGVSGSTKIGKNCMIGGQVGIIGHITIVDGTKIAAQSGVGQSLKKPGAAWQGSPCFEVMPYQRSYVKFRRLPEMDDRLRDLENQVKDLQKKLFLQKP